MQPEPFAVSQRSYSDDLTPTEELLDHPQHGNDVCHDQASAHFLALRREEAGGCRAPDRAVAEQETQPSSHRVICDCNAQPGPSRDRVSQYEWMHQASSKREEKTGPRVAKSSNSTLISLGDLPNGMLTHREVFLLS